ncbi:MAG: low temperature requirement protein A, partial [Tabrizicola sp.]|nr:low temperature requirement protein A [Tabrizicola sp.]
TQVSHFLLHHYSLAGALEAGFLFLAIWWVWIYTTWVLNWLDPDTLPVRLLLFAMMAAGLFLSMAIPDAFGERGLVFAGAYVAMQLGRSLYMLRIVWPDPARRSTYVRINLYFAASAVFWIAGGLSHDHDLRLTLWLVAMGIDFLGPILGYLVPGLGRDVSTNWRVSGAHMAERCGLFVIICLGETLLVSGATFAEMEWTALGLAAFLASVLGTGGMWWVYFHIGHRRGAHQIEHASDTGAIARRSFTYVHIPIVAGVVLSAVGAERAIAHPDHLATLGEGASVIGGLMLFLFGCGLFKRDSAGWFPLSHWAGLGLSVAVLVAGPWTTLLALNGLVALILITVAVWEHRSLKGNPHG